MKIALVLHRGSFSYTEPEFRMTAHVLDDESGAGQHELLDRLRIARGGAFGTLPDELSIHRVIDMPTIPGMTEQLTRIMAGPCSVYRGMYEAWLTEMVSTAFVKGDVIGHHDAVMGD
jgi:hypothetical protein